MGRLLFQVRLLVMAAMVIVSNSRGQAQENQDGGFVIKSEVTLTQIALRSKKGTLAGTSEKDIQVFEDGLPVTYFKFDKMPPIYSAVVLADFHEGEISFRTRWAQIEEAFNAVHKRRLETLPPLARQSGPQINLPEQGIHSADLFGKVVDEFKNSSRGSASEVTAFIIVTDGQDNLRLNSAAQELISLAKNGQVIVFAVPFGMINPDQAYFSKLAAMTGGAVFPVPRSDRIDWSALFESVYNSMDQYYSISFRPSDAHSPRWRSVKVTLKGSSDDLVYRQGYCPFAYCRIPGSPGYDGPRAPDEAKKIMTGLRLSPPQGGSGIWKGQENLTLESGQPMFFQDDSWSSKVDWQSNYLYIKSVSGPSPAMLKTGKTLLQIKKVQGKMFRPDPKLPFYDVENVFILDGGPDGEFQVGCGWPQSVLQDQSPNECLEATRKWIGWGQ